MDKRTTFLSQITATIASIDGSRSCDPTRKFVEYGPWMSVEDIDFTSALIHKADQGVACGMEDLQLLKATIQRARDRKVAGESPFCRFIAESLNAKASAPAKTPRRAHR